MTAALLVPVLVGFALEVPADAIDRIASPFIGQASAAVVTRKTEDDGLRRAVRTSMAPQLYPAGIVTAPPRRLPAAVAAPTSSVRRARRILPLDEWAGAPASAPPRADEPAPTTAVRRPRRAPLPGDEEVPVQPDHGPVPAADEPAGGTAPRTTPPAPDTGAGRADGGVSPGPAAPDAGGGAGEPGAGDGGEPVAGDGGAGRPRRDAVRGASSGRRARELRERPGPRRGRAGQLGERARSGEEGQGGRVSGVAPGSARSLAALGQRPPRLTIRVVVYTAILIGIGAATLLVFIRHFERGRAESTARLQASVVTQGVVDRLAPSDLLGPLTPARKAELRRLLETRVLDDETPAAAVATADGRVVYATPGADSSLGSLSPVLRESILSGVVTSALVDARTDGETTRVLRTYSPFRLNDGSTGVVAIDKDYAPIARSARQAAIAVAAILELVLIFLWLCLIPMMRRATKSIHRQLDTIAQLALHDDLTGLANRARLGAHLDELCEPPSGPRAFSVFFIDLDRFKDVNDTLGHDRGNELLVEVAHRLSRAVGEGELVARLGGDEFAVVSENATDADAALSLAERLSAAMGGMFEIAGIGLEPQASIGIALAPAHGSTRDELLRCADIAMYAAKRSGAPRVYARELDDHSPVRLGMAGELRRALERRELGRLLPAAVRPGRGADPRRRRRSSAGVTRPSGSSSPTSSSPRSSRRASRDVSPATSSRRRSRSCATGATRGSTSASR